MWFIGAGPGAPDLLTLRGSRLIGEADVVIWARSLVHEGVLEYAGAGAEIVESTTIPLEGVRELYERAVDEDLKVARVHSGDPSLYGAVMEQIEVCEEMGLDWEIVPGVSSLGAAAAAIGRELTVPEVSQSVILTRRASRTPMPEGEDIEGFAEPRDDHGDLPLRGEAARPAGGAPGGRLRARDPLRRRLPGELARRGGHRVPPRRPRRPGQGGRLHAGRR